MDEADGTMKSSNEAVTIPPSLFRLFASFLRLGSTAFGGPAMVAYIRKMAVEQNHWLDEPTFQDGVALCQMIPGATAMQTAAYVGLRARGMAGSAVCFVGFGLPAFCFMAGLSAVYACTSDLPLILAVFQGLRVMTVAIVVNAALTFGKRSLKGLADVIIAGLAAVLFAVKVNPILVILLAALLGLLLYRGRARPNAPVKGHLAAATGSPRSVMLILLLLAAGFATLFAADRGLFELGVLMLRIDLFAFGGGFASVPLMYHEVVDVRSWMDSETFWNGIALGQVTPGPIVITATFVGYLLFGVPGAVLATASVFLPSFLMVVGLVRYFDRLRASPHFHRCMSGILATFVGLLLSVTIQFILGTPWSVPSVALAGAAILALLRGVDVVWVVLAGVVASLLVF